MTRLAYTLAASFLVAIMPFSFSQRCEAAVPDGYEKQGDIQLYGDIGKTDPDGYRYIPDSQLSYTTVTIPKKNGSIPQQMSQFMIIKVIL
jgi:hypothetical protein